MALTAGSRIGPYEIVAPLGAGGMGEVYKARDTRLNRDVAIKVLPPSFAADEERLRRFTLEAQSAGALNHPNILVVHDVGTDGGIPYVVSELLEGQTLRDALAGGALPARKAVDYAIQTASGLAAAHERGIVHRDLKPENLFVTRDGRVKILDFGLAKLAASDPAGAGQSLAVTMDGGGTTPGLVLGTVGYMSPEQLRGDSVDARSDIFSLGAVLYEMFSGTRAFKGKTAVETMSAILREDPPEMASAASSASPAIERIVRRCLEKNRDERFQSARDLSFALDAVSNTSTSSSARMEAMPSPARRGRIGITVAAVVVAAVMAAAGYVAGRGRVTAAPTQPTIRQLTFRSGTVRGARFTPDPKTVVYAAAWEGRPLSLFTVREDSSESSAVNLPPANLLAVSSAGEMAVALKPDALVAFAVTGTLARAPLAGGAAREMIERTVNADFSPDGKQLAVIRQDLQNFQLEFPVGTALYSAPFWLSDPRVSPDGAHVAFISHPIGGDEGNVEVVDASRQRRTLSAGWLSIQGAAWSRDGREVWFTATKAGGLRAVWAVTMSGVERLVYRAPQRLTLEDIAPDGRVLLSGTTMRSETIFGSLSEKFQRKLSWFDWANSFSLSRDARLLAFTESGEGAGEKYGVYIRQTDGSPAIRLADGQAESVSPDGKWVAAFKFDVNSLQLLPTGPGAVRMPDVAPIEKVLRARWFPDSQRLLLVGHEKGKKDRSYEMSLAGGAPKPVTPEGIAAVSNSPISPDGQWLIVAGADGARRLFPMDGGPLRDLGVHSDEGIGGWMADSRGILVWSRTQPVNVARLDLATGQRTPVTTLAPGDMDGVASIGGVTFASDGDHYVYGYPRLLSELFVVDGLR
jgi:Tol biopolymer transport system component